MHWLFKPSPVPSHALSSLVYSASTVQCLKCFQTFALHNKVKILIILPSSASFSLDDAPASTDEDDRGVYCFFSGEIWPLRWYTTWTLHSLKCLVGNVEKKKGSMRVVRLCWQTLSRHVTHCIILPLVPFFSLSISSSTLLLDPLALLSSIDCLPHCELKPSRHPLR